MTAKRTLRAFVLGAALALSGCVSAGKDIHFKSRLPTQETPLLMRADSKWGLDLDFENNRLGFQPTSNLVLNYNLNKNELEYSHHLSQVNGIDLSLTYRRPVQRAMVKFAASTDFIELQINPGVQGDWVFNVNGGAYLTAAFTSEGSQCTLCFLVNTRPAAIEEDSITTKQGGGERKIGLQFGRVWEMRHIVALSYQWMNYTYSASVKKDGQPDLYRRDDFHGSGTGIGYFYVPGGSAGTTFGVTYDHVGLRWDGRTWPSDVWGVRMSLQFN